jgi:hypothetical protein
MQKLLISFILCLFVVSVSNAQDGDWRYIVSSTIPKNGVEAKLFNNLYSQQSGPGDGILNERGTYFTSFFSFLYGVSDRFNAGIDARFRGVRIDDLPSSPFSLFNFESGNHTRYGLTTIGPKVRIAPFTSIPKFSIQSQFWFPLGEELTGNSTDPFIDWDGPSWWTQFFNDFSIGNSFAVFGEVDFFIEDIGRDRLNRISTPVTVIFSYFPVENATLYLLGGYSPFWQENYDYFVQAGVGAKYQFNPQFEVELLYTYFTNGDLQFTGGRAATYNIGFRYSTPR